MQQRAKNQTNNRSHTKSSNSLMGMMFYGTLMAGLMLCHQLPTATANANATYKDDACVTKSKPGLCKGWSECTVMKTLIERGEYTNRDVVSCGFGVKEELICCPAIMTDSKIELTTDKTVEITSTSQPRDFWLDVLDELKSNSTTATPTTTQKPDFWLDLLSTTTTTTTQKPDFWLDLLSTTTTTTTTTTTMKPLEIGGKRLDESSEFFDFSQLLNGKSGSQRIEANPIGIPANNQQNVDNSQDRDNNGLPAAGTNSQWSWGNTPNQGNIGISPPNSNTGPVNINQWNFDSTNGQPNFGPTNNRGQPNGQFGRDSQNIGIGSNFQNNNNNNFGNNGRGNGGRGRNINDNFQNNGRGNGGRGPNINNNFQNNNRGTVGRGQHNNQVLKFPNNNNNGQNSWQNSSPDQNFAASNVNNQIVEPPVNNDNEHDRVNQIINTVFITPENHKPNMDDVIWNIFNEPTHPSGDKSNPTVLWLNNADTPVSQVEYVDPHYQPLAVTHEQLNMPPGQIIEMHVDANDLEAAPTNHIVVEQQLDPGSSWQEATTFNPIQTVYENLVNSGMQIVQAKADKVERIYQQQQQNFGFEPSQAQNPQQQIRHDPQGQQSELGRQPNHPQQFGQQSQFGQQPNRPQNFGQQPNHLQQFGQQSQFGQQPNHAQQFGQQAQFGQQPNNAQQFGQQSHFGQQANRPQNFGQQPNNPQQFGQQTHFAQQPNHQPQSQFGQRQPSGLQQFGQQANPQQPRQQSQQVQVTTQQGPEPKQSRSPNPFIQLPPNGPHAPNVQTAPANILDPFKPFEFRPPPNDEVVFVEGDNSIRPSPGPVPTTKPTERPAVRACQRILKGLNFGLSPHILGGTPAQLGEFPHMVAIGYSRLGDDGQGPYDIRCGGSLIDSRYVLTAAHCVAARDSVPAIARMGVVNFTDTKAMEDAVEIKIKEIFIHDDYSQRRTYNDIAILELERPAPLNEIIHPVCLYIDEADPKPEDQLYVTGWGTINTATRAFSDILLKARLFVTSIERCNASFVDYGLTRQIDQGIIKTQLCAEDTNQVRDACQGDSGGPLNLVVDESTKNYRLVGVVSSGFGCASSTPGLYTRVAAFLDFIERICWPNGGD